MEKEQNSILMESNTSHSESFITVGLTIIAKIGIDIVILDH